MSKKMPRLESITEEQKQKAFKKVTEKFKFDECKLVRVTDEYYRAALDFARDVFYPDEPIYSAVGSRWGPDLEEVWLKALRRGFSLMVINEESGETVAFRITNIVFKDVGFPFDQITDVGTRLVWEYEHISDEKAKIFERFGFEEALYFMGLCVNPKYRRRGIAQKIVDAALYMYKNLNVGPILIKAEASSNYSKRIFEKVGFIKLYELPFDEYYKDGVLVFKNTGINKSQSCHGMVLNPINSFNSK